AISVAAVLLSVVMDLHFVPRPLRLPFGILFILLWVVVYVFYFRFQLEKIRHAPYPMIRAWETLLVGAVLFVTIFANAYHQIAQLDPQAFTEDLDLFTSYYFTVTVLGTVGFGDITPVTTFARSISMAQMVVDLGIIAFSVRLLTREVKQTTVQRAAGSGEA
ncbi:MAG: potassium channel family protein, partial [bacterium]